MKTILMLLLCVLTSVAQADNPYSVEASIYKVVVSRPGSTSSGTGVLVAMDKILTNCHVVEGDGGWPSVIQRKTGDRFRVTKYYKLGNLDACILVGGFAGAPVRVASTFVPGENVWIFGFPAGIPVVGQGTVKGYVDVDVGRVLQLVAFCAPGSSGGPVVNVKGELIGLNFGVFKYQNHCLSIPASALQPHL